MILNCAPADGTEDAVDKETDEEIVEKATAEDVAKAETIEAEEKISETVEAEASELKKE